MMKLRYEEAYDYGAKHLGGAKVTAHDFAGFVVGVDWAYRGDRLPAYSIERLWEAFNELFRG